MLPPDTTLCIKAYERPECLLALLQSIREFYPALPVLVGDDSLKPSAFDIPGVQYLPMPHDIGLSEGRNLLVLASQSELFVLLDDDFLLTPATDLSKLHETLEAGYDIVGGNALDARGRRTCTPGYIREFSGHHTILPPQDIDKVQACEFVPNFFLGRRDAVLGVGWNPVYKIGPEHMDFFVQARGRLRVGFDPRVSVRHDHQQPSPVYRAQRARSASYMKLFTQASQGSSRRPCTVCRAT